MYTFSVGTADTPYYQWYWNQDEDNDVYHYNFNYTVDYNYSCPHCGLYVTNAYGYKYCPYCGKKLYEVRDETLKELKILLEKMLEKIEEIENE
jgi:rRNA maturation endonuclease Nob1